MGSSSRLFALETLLHEGKRSGDPDVAVALSRLASEVAERTDQGSTSDEATAYFVGALRALSSINGPIKAEARCEALWDCYRYFFVNGESDLAMSCAESLAITSRHCASTFWYCKAGIGTAVIHAEEHRIGDAFIAYAKVIDIAQRDGHRTALSAAWTNIGITLNYGGLYRDAIPCLLRAREVALADELTHINESAVLCNLAQSYYFLDQHEEGIKAITRSLQLSREPTASNEVFNRTVRELTFVQLASALNLRNEAEYHANQCAYYAAKIPSAKAAFNATLAKGIVEVRFKDPVSGIATLKSCLRSEIVDVGIMRADALTAIVRACDEIGQSEVALDYLRELIALIRTSRRNCLSHASSLTGLPISLGEGNERQDLRALESIELRIKAKLAQDDATRARVELMERLAIAADLKEDFTGEHGFRVGAMSAALAIELGWSPDQCYSIEAAARLHDIGKTAVPDRILLSPETLRTADRQFISAHTTIGAEILGGSEIPLLQIAQSIVRYHHEWWNGEGYPSKLSGTRIPIHARIVALADVFDALTHGRPYAPAWPVDRALAEIRSRRGTQFDPELTDVFLNLMERLINEYEDLDAYLGRASQHSPFLQARNKIRQMLETERENEKRASVEGNQTRH